MGPIFENYGLKVWSVLLFFNAFYQIIRWSEYKAPSPYVHLLRLLQGAAKPAEVFVRSLVLMVFGLASYRIAKNVWSLEMSPLHVGRGAVLDSCIYPWSAVDVSKAVASEFLGTAALIVGPQLAVENRWLANNDPRYLAAVISAQVVGIVLLALDFSGGLFNPMLASVLFGGCQGQEWWQHVLVYWFGATAGAVAGAKVYPYIRNVVYPALNVDEAKKSE